MRLSLRSLTAPVLLLVALTVPTTAGAQGTATATLQVSARVVHSCSINSESSAGDANSSVRVVCGRSALRALRMSTSTDAAGDIVTLDF